MKGEAWEDAAWIISGAEACPLIVQRDVVLRIDVCCAWCVGASTFRISPIEGEMYLTAWGREYIHSYSTLRATGATCIGGFGAMVCCNARAPCAFQATPLLTPPPQPPSL